MVDGWSSIDGLNVNRSFYDKLCDEQSELTLPELLHIQEI